MECFDCMFLKDFIRSNKDGLNGKCLVCQHNNGLANGFAKIFGHGFDGGKKTTL